jgi:hypothetical protein
MGNYTKQKETVERVRERVAEHKEKVAMYRTIDNNPYVNAMDTVASLHPQVSGVVNFRRKVSQMDMKRHERLLQEAQVEKTAAIETLSKCRAKAAAAMGGGPENWGITMNQLRAFHNEIREELRDYCNNHRLAADGSFTHVCVQAGCKCNHGCAKHRDPTPQEDVNRLEPVLENMHTVNEIFIKPRTLDNDGLYGYALKLNKNQPKKIETFVSHTWNGLFEDLVDAVQSHVDADQAVFICTFALPQNIDVNAIIGDTTLDRTPFAKAHNVCRTHILAVDRNFDVLTRIWVNYELYLSFDRGKSCYACASRRIRSPAFLEAMGKYFHTVDVRDSTASRVADYNAIMAAISGEEDDVNRDNRLMLKDMHVRLCNNHF